MDRRDLASSKRWWDSLDGLTAYMKEGGYDDDGEPIVARIPVTFTVCTTCDGKGSYVNPNIDRNGIDPQDFHDDPEFSADYRSGMFDLPCAHCEGLRVIPVPIDEAMQKQVQEGNDAMEEYYSEVQAEIDFGA